MQLVGPHTSGTQLEREQKQQQTSDLITTQENEMRLPARYAPVLFSALLSAIMVCIVSAFVLTLSQGIHPGFLAQWLRSCVTTWPVAFPTVAIVAPWVRRIVGRMTA
jgi:hypothetical protein